jgi:hypothetical protein
MPVRLAVQWLGALGPTHCADLFQMSKMFALTRAGTNVPVVAEYSTDYGTKPPAGAQRT